MSNPCAQFGPRPNDPRTAKRRKELIEELQRRSKRPLHAPQTAALPREKGHGRDLRMERRAARGAVPRPRQLQEHQRHARPPDRRPAAGGRVRTHQAGLRQCFAYRPAGGRRVRHHPAPAGQRPGRAGTGAAPDRDHRQDLRDQRPPHQYRRQHRRADGAGGADPGLRARPAHPGADRSRRRRPGPRRRGVAARAGAA